MTEQAPEPGEQTRRLVAAADELLAWLRGAVPEPHGGPECQWCPICQLARVLRAERPEFADRLTEAGTALAAVLRGLLETGDRPGDRPAGPADRPRPAPRVQPIRLDDEPDP